MTAQTSPRTTALCTINHIRLGETYLTTTRDGFSVGEYLGIEVPHGDRSILLRTSTGTRSIQLGDLLSIHPVAA